MSIKTFIIHKLLKGATVVKSDTNPDDFCVNVGNIRLIFQDGKYVGWHKP